MSGSILLVGGSKEARLAKANELLLGYGFSSKSSSPDLLVISKESDRKSIGIEQASQVRKFMQERPFEKVYKAVVIEDAHTLTDAAQNSLLHVLEEPPSYGVVLLLSDKEGSLLPTVVSRCRKTSVTDALQERRVLAEFNLNVLSFEALFDLAKEISSRGKEEALDFLEGVLSYDISLSAEAPGYSALAIRTEAAIKELREANVALKFALEYLFLLHKLSLC